MQQLLEPLLHSDSWSPVKIKFNWDASYWTKQISSLGKIDDIWFIQLQWGTINLVQMYIFIQSINGCHIISLLLFNHNVAHYVLTKFLLWLCSSAGQLTVEGGNCTYPQSLACSTIMGPQPITCLTVPSVFHRGLDPGCGYQVCCEPQMWCLHGIPSQPDLPSLDKSQLEATHFNSSCVQPAHIAASMHQNQLLQKCWDTESSSQCPPTASPVIESIQLKYSQGSMSQSQAAVSHPQSHSKSYSSYHQLQREALPNSQAQLSGGRRRSGQCQVKLLASTTQQELSHTGMNRDAMNDESWEKRCRVEKTHGQTAAVESRKLLNGELQEGRREQSPVQQQQQQQLHVPPAVDLRKEQQRTRPALILRDHKDGRVSNRVKIRIQFRLIFII